MANLATVAKKAVAAGFKVAASLQVGCTYYRTGTGTYAAATGTVTASETTATVNPIFGSFTAEERTAGGFRTGDKKIILRQSDLDASGIVPTLDDYLVETTSGKRWEVVSVEKDPTNNVWILGGRSREA